MKRMLKYWIVGVFLIFASCNPYADELEEAQRNADEAEKKYQNEKDAIKDLYRK